MPRFSQGSFSKLSTCHNDLQVLFFEVVKFFDCKVLEGHRNQSTQDQYFKEGKSKLTWPNGKHNSEPSLAVDVAPFPVPSWEQVGDFIYFGGYVMGVAARLFEEGKITHKVRYGGDWNNNQRTNDEIFKDFVHFEIIL